MALRSMFKGTLVFGRTKLPIKLYAAVEDRRVRFRFLSPRDHRPVTQQMVDTTTGKVVPSKSIRRGFPLASLAGGPARFDEQGSYVLFSPEELKKLQPKASREVRLLHRLPRGAVPAEWYVRPYFVGPDGNTEAYLALHAALRQGEESILAHWVMRGNEYTGVLRAEETGLSLTTLRHAGEVVDASELKPPAAQATAKEMTMAKQLVEAFSDEFDPELFRDEYGERVRALVEAKRKGKRVRLRKVPEKTASEGSLAGALSKSLKLKERHVA